jgi:hypothetical protein
MSHGGVYAGRMRRDYVGTMIDWGREDGLQS